MSSPPDDVPAAECPVHLFSNFALATCNMARGNTVVEPDRASTRGRLPRYTFAFKMFKRHHLSVARVQEHHLHTDAELSAAEYRAGLHGYNFVGLPSPELKSGVCLRYQPEWEFVSFTPLSSRILCVVVKHPDGFSVAFVVGHFHNDAVQRMRQWHDLQGHERRLGGVPMVFLADHNSILSHLDSTRKNIWSLHELSAMESERDCLQAFAVHDAWAHQFQDRDSPGYTRTSVLRRAAGGARTVSRRIDRISVSHSLLGCASSMFTTPVGFSDHNSVVLQFVGMGPDGEQPTRWKYPLDALQDPDTLDWVTRELQRLEEEGVQGLEAFQRSQVVSQDAARRYNANAPVATPSYLRLRDILRRSSPEYVPLAGFAPLRDEGQRPGTMRDAYIALDKAVSVHRGVEQLKRTYTRVREAVQDKHHLQEVRRWRARALHRLMHQAQESRIYGVLKARSGHLLRNRHAIARESVAYWSTIMRPGQRSEEECYQWLEARGLAAQWRTAVPLLWQGCSEDLVYAALQQMDPSSSHGDDGIQAGVYKVFPEFFVRNMYRAYQEIEVDGLPDEWVTALVRSLPKDPGSAAVDRQRPIALQQARLKWLTGVLLLQLQGALFQLVPSQQKAYLRGRTMFDRLASVQQTSHTGPGDEVAAWLVVDYSKAYDSVSHPMMAALFRFICIPTPWVCVLLQILRDLVLFLVMGGVVREHSLTPA